jgi:GTP-binding protein Era
MSENHKSGFVNILGNPNVGKSTLMNALMGEKLSIVSSKAQTTRHRIMGIINGEDFQIVFSDTPGILKPLYKLQESMLNFTKSALEDADLIIYVTDIYETKEKNEEFLQKVQNTEVPVFLIINKIDLTTQEKLGELAVSWQELLPQAEIFPVSALEKFNLDNLLKSITAKLPVSPPYFPKDQVTDKSERFFVQEIIREKILMNYKKEIPYSVEVEVEEFKEEEDIIRIKSLIYVSRDTQKGIIIGHKGEALKKTATQARIDMEAFFDKKVFLEVFVKVEKDWRDKKNFLDKFGYNQ